MSFQLPEVGKDRGEWGGILNATLTWLKNQVANVQSAMSGKADVEHNHDERYYTADQVDAELLNKADVGHDHDDRYYTETEVDALLDDLEVGAGLDDQDIADLLEDAESATRTALDSLLSEGYAPVEHFHDEQYSQLGHNHDSDYAALDHNHDDRYVRTVNNIGPDEEGNVTVDAGGGGGVTDHGDLDGLEDDDHPQYALADGSRGNFAASDHDHDGEYVTPDTLAYTQSLTLTAVPTYCRWDSDSETWEARPVVTFDGGDTYTGVPPGVVYISTFDPDAPPPDDPVVGDKWERHPDAAPLGD